MAFAMTGSGIQKFTSPAWERMFRVWGYPDHFYLVIGGIEAACGVRPAVIVSDSFGRAWRIGQTDVAIGLAGLEPVDHWHGRADAFGRELRVSSIATADSAAAAADLARAKDSLEPVVLVRGLERHVTPEDGPGAAAMRRPSEQDLFR